MESEKPFMEELAEAEAEHEENKRRSRQSGARVRKLRREANADVALLRAGNQPAQAQTTTPEEQMTEPEQIYRFGSPATWRKYGDPILITAAAATLVIVLLIPFYLEFVQDEEPTGSNPSSQIEDFNLQTIEVNGKIIITEKPTPLENPD